MTAGGPVGIAVVGCGDISNQYLPNLASFPAVRVVYCADLDAAAAREKADRYGVPEHGDLATALARPDVDLVVNLTVPAAHADVAAAALDAGKHVWNEKPLALDLDLGRGLVDRAERDGLRLGCAPDTVLGAGVQTARRLIDSGAIGTPLSAIAMMQSPGPESWHPNPAFLFGPGGGPLLDIGPYYLSALGMLFGPVARVAALGTRGRETRVVGSGPLAGTRFPVEVPTHVAALAEYAAGPVASLVLSFDSPLSRPGFVEITGTEATLAVPDPNQFTGEVRLRRTGASDWESVPAAGSDAGRGIGVVDMVANLRAGRPHRASGRIALHVLDTMLAIERSSAERSFQEVTTGFDLPEPVDPAWDPRAGGEGMT